MSRKTRRPIHASLAKESAMAELQAAAEEVERRRRKSQYRDVSLPQPDGNQLRHALAKLKGSWSKILTDEDAEAVRELLDQIADTRIALVNLVLAAEMPTDPSIAAGQERKRQREAEAERRAREAAKERTRYIEKQAAAREQANRQAWADWRKRNGIPEPEEA